MTLSHERLHPVALAAERVRWNPRGHLVIDDASIWVKADDTVGLLGPNGSGKSTLLRMLAGLRRPDEGSLTVAGRAVHTMPKKELARHLAMVEQEASSDLDLRVRDVIELGRIPHRRPWATTSAEDRAIVERSAALTEIADRLDQPYLTLSGGERQRAQIARALAQEPEILLLDEPTNHLDVRHQLSLMDLVRRMPVTSLVALHDLNLAATYCDQVFVLDRGRVVAGGPPSQVLSEQLIAEVYGVEADVRHDITGVSFRFRSAL